MAAVFSFVRNTNLALEEYEKWLLCVVIVLLVATIALAVIAIFNRPTSNPWSAKTVLDKYATKAADTTKEVPQAPPSGILDILIPDKRRSLAKQSVAEEQMARLVFAVSRDHALVNADFRIELEKKAVWLMAAQICLLCSAAVAAALTLIAIVTGADMASASRAAAAAMQPCAPAQPDR
ncbi:hypothetical protein [Variovorax sp. J22R115]|uniref:hypothetical protein n=1 Tax=Variovorax sp. J22R115 TaxID=3053509 RepID=UPI0025776A8A|nr:hypothetical protein [Variovorax sp. J22R115]MDM0049927.1 hypothetical protein [Variovorax sp. J22R115]